MGIKPGNVVELNVGQGEVLVLSRCIVGILVVLGIGLSFVDGILLLLEEFVESLRSDTPATQVEVATILHSQLQAALPLQALTGLFFRREVGSGIEIDLALVGSVGNMLGNRILGTLADVVDDGTGFL